MRVLLMNTRNEVVSVRTVYIGTVNTTSIRGAEVFKDAVREGLPGIILVHNHPSGDPTPSLMDREMTTQLRKAGRLLNVEVLDHIIIGRQGHYSLKETGWPLV
jgi:DNA repair protein RadC